MIFRNSVDHMRIRQAPIGARHQTARFPSETLHTAGKEYLYETVIRLFGTEAPETVSSCFQRFITQVILFRKSARLKK